MSRRSYGSRHLLRNDDGDEVHSYDCHALAWIPKSQPHKCRARPFEFRVVANYRHEAATPFQSAILVAAALGAGAGAGGYPANQLLVPPPPHLHRYFDGDNYYYYYYYSYGGYCRTLQGVTIRWWLYYICRDDAVLLYGKPRFLTFFD